MNFEIGSRYILRRKGPAVLPELFILKEPKMLIEIKLSNDGKFFKLKFEGDKNFLSWKFHKKVENSSLKEVCSLRQEEMDL